MMAMLIAAHDRESADQVLLHEGLQRQGPEHDRHGERQPCAEQEGQTGACPSRRRRRIERMTLRRSTTGLERRPGRHPQHQAGEGAIGLRPRHRRPAAGGVVQVHALPGRPLHDDEVGELPVHDAGERLGGEAVELDTDALRLQAVGGGRPGR